MNPEITTLFENIVCKVDVKTLKFLNIPYELIFSLGYSKENIQTLAFGDMCDYESLIQITSADEYQTYKYPISLQHKKGHWIRFHVTFFRDKDSYYFNFTELTSPATNQPDVYSQIYQQIIDQGEMLILIYRLDGKILFVSENSDSIWGYKQSEVIDTYAQTYYAENQLKVAKKITTDAIESQQSVSFRIRVKHRRGYKIWLEGVTKIFNNENFELEGFESFLCIARDVTHKMNTELALYQSQNIQEAVFENSNEPILMTDPDLTILGFNKAASQAALDFMGLQVFTGAPLQTYVEYFKFHTEDLHTIIRNRQTKRIECCIKNLNTEKMHWIDLSINPVYKNKDFIGLFVTGVDFTSAKEAQEALSVSEKRFRDLICNAPDIIGVLNSLGNVEIVSDEHLHKIQSIEEVLGLKRTDVRQFLQSEMKECRIEHQYTDEKDVKLVDLIYKKTDGETLIFGRDITERNKIQTALDRTGKQYQSIFENSPVGLAVLTLKGVLTSVNPAFCYLLQYSQQEIVGDSILEMIFPADIPEFTYTVLRKNTHSINDVRIEIRLMKKDGNTVHTIARAYRSEEDKILIQLIDISYRVEAELKLLDSLREKEVLLKEIHHRVKNNLQIISSLLFLQSNQYDNDGVKEFYQKSQSRIMSIAMLHEQLYRSAELSKIPMKPYIETLISFIRSTIEEFNHAIQIVTHAEDLSLSVEKAPPLGLIINELVTNALKHAFTGNDGLLEITLSRKAKKILLRIEDNGKGLPDNFQEAKKHSLGFELIEMLVNQVDGKMLMGNKPDQGCFFEIYFSE